MSYKRRSTGTKIINKLNHKTLFNALMGACGQSRQMETGDGTTRGLWLPLQLAHNCKQANTVACHTCCSCRFAGTVHRRGEVKKRWKNAKIMKMRSTRKQSVEKRAENWHSWQTGNQATKTERRGGGERGTNWQAKLCLARALHSATLRHINLNGSQLAARWSRAKGNARRHAKSAASQSNY